MEKHSSAKVKTLADSSRRGKAQDFAYRLTPFRNKAGHTKLHWHFKGMTCLPQHFLTKSMTPNFVIPRQLKARMLSKSQVPQNTRKDLKPFPISLGRDLDGSCLQFWDTKLFFALTRWIRLCLEVFCKAWQFSWCKEATLLDAGLLQL